MWTLASALASVCAAMAVEVEEGFKALEQGKVKRAERIFRAVDSATQGASAEAALGLAKVANRREEWEVATKEGRRAMELAGPNDPLEVAALGELVLAVSATGGSEGGVSRLIGRLRELLVPPASSELTRAARVRLCTARAMLVDSHPESLARPAGSGEARDLIHGGEAERPVEIGGDVHRPRKIRGDDAPRLNRVERALIGNRAAATVDTLIDADGCVIEARLVNASHQLWGDAFADLVQSWVFEPARDGERPLTVRYRLVSTRTVY
jgi:hypothetical protein